jgi:hypothetical protein
MALRVARRVRPTRAGFSTLHPMILRPKTHELDAAFAAAKAGDVIELGPGIHRTMGNYAAGQSRGWCQLAAGVRVVGAGSRKTIIQLHPDARTATLAQRPDRDTNVLWGNVDISISGITFDANYRHLPECHVGGLRFHGRYELEDVRVIGLHGSWQAPKTLTKEIEVFAVSSVGNSGGSRLEKVTVGEVAPSAYVSGIFVGSTVEVSEASKVSDCLVELGSGNQFGYSANRRVSFWNCVSTGGRYGFYNDTGPTQDVTLDQCDLSGSHAAVSLIAKAPDGVRSAVRVLRSRIRGGRGIEVWDRTNTAIAAEALLDSCDIDVDYITAVANSGPVRVTVQNSLIADRAKAFRSAASPPAVLSFNRRPNGVPGVDTFPELVS